MRPLEMFCFLLAAQHFFQRTRRFFLFIQNGVNLINYGRLDLQMACALKSAPRSGNSFGHHPHGLVDLHDSFASPETFADCVVAAALTYASHNQIARAA